MAKEEKQKNPVEAERGENVGEKTRFSRRMPLLLLILAVVLAVVVLTTMEDGRHFASLRRWLMYGDSGQTQNLYTYAADASNRYGQLGDELLVVGPKSISLLRDDGTAVYNLPVNMNEPRLTVGGKLAAVCDVGEVPCTCWTAPGCAGP